MARADGLLVAAAEERWLRCDEERGGGSGASSRAAGLAMAGEGCEVGGALARGVLELELEGAAGEWWA